MTSPRIPWQEPINDEAERLYDAGGPTRPGHCNLCGSFGTLYHFNGWQEICPFCVIKEARKELIEKADAVIGAYAGRWVRVDCTPEEERTLRELNDLLNELVPDRMSDEQKAARAEYNALKDRAQRGAPGGGSQ